MTVLLAMIIKIEKLIMENVNVLKDMRKLKTNQYVELIAIIPV